LYQHDKNQLLLYKYENFKNTIDMKTLILFLGFFLCLSPMYAQKEKSNKVSSNYLHIPILDPTQTDPATMSFEFSNRAVEFGKEAMKDIKTVCKNNATGKAQEVTTYYYQIDVTKPESFVLGRDANGKVVFASKVSETEMIKEKFGYQKCKNFRSDNLKKTWAANGGKFKQQISTKIENELSELASVKAKEGVYPFYLPMNFEVYYAKGKDVDYSELDKALEMAESAYKDIEKNGLNKKSQGELQACITIWEKELKSKDLTNKKARINKDIAKGLHENCARAYAFIYQFDQALEHGRQVKVLFGNYSNNRTVALDQFISLMREQSIRLEKNPSIINDLQALNDLAQSFDKQKLDVKRLPVSSVEVLSKAYSAFAMDKQIAHKEDMKNQEEKLIAEGKVNPYAKYVNKTATGTSILMNLPPSSFSGIPELTEFPKEICSMDDVDQVMIVSNKIERVPAEIVQMKSLNNLNLSGNAFTSIPTEICQLSELTKLNLSNNPITDFPKEIAQLKKLKKLNLKKTKLSSEKQAELVALLPNCKISF
jgi:hypothetical protein